MFCRVLLTGVLVLHFPTLLLAQTAEQPAAKATEDKLVDAFGDPLPASALARLGTSRFRFGGGVSAAALSPNGQWLVISNGSDILTLADARSGKDIARVRSPGGFGVNALLFAGDNKRLAILGYGPMVQVIDIPSGKALGRFQPQTPQQPQNIRLTHLAFSGDGNVLAAATDNFGQPKNFVFAWDVTNNKAFGPFEVMQNSQIKAALSRDGSLLATWGFYNPPPGVGFQPNNPPEQGRIIQLWDVKTGKEQRKVKIDRNHIVAAALSPDGKLLAAASGAATFHLFDADTGKELRRFAGRRGQTLVLTFAPDGSTLVAASAEGTVQMWEAQTGKRLGLGEGTRQRVFGVAFPDTKNVLALSSEGQAIALWNVTTGVSLTPPGGHHFMVRSLTFLADGKTLVSSSTEGRLCWWDVASGKETKTFVLRDQDAPRYGYSPYSPNGGFNNFAISANGKYLAAATDYGFSSIRLWNLENGQVLCDFDAPRTNSPAGFGFSPDGARLAAISNKAVLIWNTATGEELRSLPFKEDLANTGGMSGGAVAFSPDGNYLAAARTYYDRNTGTPIGEIYLWRTDKGTQITHVERAGSNIHFLAFSPDSQFLAMPMQNRSVMLLRASSGKEVGRFEGSQASVVQSLAFSPDGRLLAGAQTNTYVYAAPPVLEGQVAPAPSAQRILVWEVASGQIRQEFSGHHGAVSCLAFAPDGKTLASGGADTTILLWDLYGSKNAPPLKLSAEQAWNELSQRDARKTFDSLMKTLVAQPQAALDVIQKNLRPVKNIKVQPDEIDQLIADLDHEKFQVRVKATASLEQLGDLAGPALRKAVGVPNISLEAQRRIKGLIDKLDQAALTPEEVRVVRAVEILEKIATPEARAVLQELADGAPQARVTQEAQAALKRLRK